MKLCQDCPERPWCELLCEKAEEYIDQDHVFGKELVPDIPVDIWLQYHEAPDMQPADHRNKKSVILLYFLSRKKVSEISLITGYSRQWIYRVIRDAYEQLGI